MLSPLTIPDRDFALLAAGGGDRATMAALLAGQFSRRVLLVVAVLDAARRKAPGAVPILEASYTLLSDVQRTHPHLVAEVLTLPCAGNWAAACLRGDATEATYHYLACLAASAAFRAGREFQIEVPVLNGALYLPMLGSMAVRGGGMHAAVIRRGNEGLAITPAGNGRTVIPDVRAPAHRWRPARVLRTNAGGRGLTVWLDDCDPFRAPPGLRIEPTLAAKEAARWQRILDQAWQSLVRRHREHADGMSAGLRALTPLRERAEPGSDSDSATATDAIGGVLLTPPRQAEHLALTLLHEFQHTKLAALEQVVALHNGDQRRRYQVWWRDDPRPLGAALHGAYAHLAVAGYWDSALRLGDAYPRDIARKELAYWCEAVGDALAQISQSGALTMSGDRFIAGMTLTLSQLRNNAAIPAY
ncbi:MAG: HEXXH motif domain-containing protein [Streptosporangiaceae bacterium]|jgi:HEXXH motif-containing protein